MSKLCFLTVILTFAVNTLFAQVLKSRAYQLNGTINADTGKISYHLFADSSFYPKDFFFRKAGVVKQRKFYLKGSLPYPVGVMLTNSTGTYQSNMFLIEPGVQSITVNIDSNREVPKVDNTVMQEYYHVYLPFYKSTDAQNRHLDTEWTALVKRYNNNIPDSARLAYMVELKRAYARSDSTLLAYTRSHPDSYLALWKLVQLIPFGYAPIFDTIYSSFTNRLKSTHTGKVLGEKIASFKSLTCPGKVFPSIACIDSTGQPMTSITGTQHNYTFVDFWYSNCAPCVVQFPGLIAVYQDYHDKGLEIIGVSTDKTRYRTNWLKAIKDHKVSWPQYWDKDGKEAARLNITAFPTNFLLDGAGKIVAQNLSFVELRSFMQRNIQQP